MARDAAARAEREDYARRRLFRSRCISDKLGALRERMALPASEAPPAVPSTFGLLYESRDGRLCLFESASGHLTAVDSSRLV